MQESATNATGQPILTRGFCCNSYKNGDGADQSSCAELRESPIEPATPGGSIGTEPNFRQLTTDTAALS